VILIYHKDNLAKQSYSIKDLKLKIDHIPYNPEIICSKKISMAAEMFKVPLKWTKDFSSTLNISRVIIFSENLNIHAINKYGITRSSLYQTRWILLKNS